MGREINVARKNKEIIVSQATAPLFIEQFFDRKTITALVGIQDIKSLGRIKVLLFRHDARFIVCVDRKKKCTEVEGAVKPPSFQRCQCGLLLYFGGILVTCDELSSQ